MAIAYSKTNRPEEAIRCYRKALEAAPELAGAHYGLAFLLLKRQDESGATTHLEAFLAKPPSGPDADRWIKHAAETLAAIRSGTANPNSSEP